jgi:hypothetical protein
LGAGKTLSLTYLGYRNWIKGRNIFTNYKIMFPELPDDMFPVKPKIIPIKSVKMIEDMREGYFLGDELWSWLDSHVPIAKRNRVVSSILLKSRKRGIDISYTTQSFHQVDRRIRGITDFLSVPFLNVNETICRLQIYTYPAIAPVRQFKFMTAPFFELFDTREEIGMLEEEEAEMKRKEQLDILRQKKEELRVKKEEREIERLKKELAEEESKEEIAEKEEVEAELKEEVEKTGDAEINGDSIEEYDDEPEDDANNEPEE